MTNHIPVYRVVTITYIGGVAHIDETRDLTKSYATALYQRLTKVYADRDDVEVLLEQQTSSFGGLELDSLTIDEVEF